jgi:hypothetical protein
MFLLREKEGNQKQAAHSFLFGSPFWVYTVGRNVRYDGQRIFRTLGRGPAPIDDKRVHEHLGRIVRGTIKETVNAMPEAKDDRLSMTGAQSRRTKMRKILDTTNGYRTISPEFHSCPQTM